MTTPSDEQFYNSLAPDLKRKVDDNRAARKVAELKQAQLAALNVRSWQEGGGEREGGREQS